MTLASRIEEVDAVACTLSLHDWRFARDNAEAIAERWRAECARKPQLFDGRVLLARTPAIEKRGDKRVFTCAFFETSFSAFTAAREWGFPDKDVFNCFAMAAVRASDGGFLLGEMGSGTANDGHIYFPAGTPDRDDIEEDRVDLDGSVLRELEEETGLSARDVSVGAGMTIVTCGQQIACMRLVQIEQTAEDARRDIEATLASQAHPEFVRMHVVRSERDIVAGLTPPFVSAYLRYKFAERAIR